ncbi:hypothetical protein [Lysinibacillus xylanilyticus]|uniref:hypothetical protein n=1 Tax=Lysinibacillus xylanilyticus TaxID=582475 RepID=UPI0038046B90
MLMLNGLYQSPLQSPVINQSSWYTGISPPPYEITIVSSIKGFRLFHESIVVLMKVQLESINAWHLLTP